MDKDARHAQFEVDLLPENQIRIETGGLSIVTEYLPDDGRRAEFMGPANVFFAGILA